ncbi:hypothetical protein BLNAU_5709 [Blattamonas nauphoetae]|uniref:Uncharacterized protein n=1 Tax=Blattamonas nauphoetae TaxID=2049346 RepID=A0ABQ9Y6N0_9EUKA|nr:hypothetical protein BLNAU_5709 [Blattamonas nauphoetae]
MLFDDDKWLSKLDLELTQLPPAFQKNLSAVTPTLAEIYADWKVPDNTVNAMNTVSQKHSIPLPTTMKFMNLLNTKLKIYFSTHEKPDPDKKKPVVFKIRSKDPSKRTGKEKVFKKVKIVIRGDNGEELDHLSWRAQFMQNEDLDDFRFSTLLNRFRTLEDADMEMGRRLGKRPLLGGKRKKDLSSEMQEEEARRRKRKEAAEKAAKGKRRKGDGEDDGEDELNENAKNKAGEDEEDGENGRRRRGGKASKADKARGKKSGEDGDDADELDLDLDDVIRVKLPPVGFVVENDNLTDDAGKEHPLEGRHFKTSDGLVEIEEGVLKLKRSNSKIPIKNRVKYDGQKVSTEYGDFDPNDTMMVTIEDGEVMEWEIDNNGGLRKRRRGDASRARGEGEAAEEEEDDGDDEDGYDYGIVQTIVMDSRGNIIEITEKEAEEGETIEDGAEDNKNLLQTMQEQLKMNAAMQEELDLEDDFFEDDVDEEELERLRKEEEERIAREEERRRKEAEEKRRREEEERLRIEEEERRKREEEEERLRKEIEELHRQQIEEEERIRIRQRIQQDFEERERQALFRQELEKGRIEETDEEVYEEEEREAMRRAMRFWRSVLEEEEANRELLEEPMIDDDLEDIELDEEEEMIDYDVIFDDEPEEGGESGLDGEGNFTIAKDDAEELDLDLDDEDEDEDELDENGKKKGLNTDLDGDPLDLMLDDLDPFLDTDKRARDALRKRSKKAPSESALNRAAYDAISDMFDGESDLAQSGEGVNNEKFLVVASLIEVILLKQSQMKGKRMDDAMQTVDQLKFLSKTAYKGIEAVDKHIGGVVQEFKDNMRANDHPKIHRSDLTFNMIFMNRAAVVKVPLLADEEFIVLLKEKVVKDPRVYYNLGNTIALLARKPENHPFIAKHGIIELITQIYYSRNSDPYVLTFAELICFTAPDTQCRTIIMSQEDIVRRSLSIQYKYAKIDEYSMRYLAGFLYVVSQSAADMKQLLDGGVLHALYKTMHDYQIMHEDIMRLTTGTLHNLARDRNSLKDMIKNDMLSYCFTVAKDHKDGFPDTVKYTFSVVVNALQFKEGREAALREAQHIPLIIDALRLYQETELELTQSACILLNFYAKAKKENLGLLLENGIIDVMVNVINDNKRFPIETITQAIAVLASLATNWKASLPDLNKTNLVPTLGGLLDKYYKKQARVTEAILGVLAGMSTDEKNAKILGALKVHEAALNSVLERYKETLMLVNYGCGVLMNICAITTFSTHFFQQDGFDTMNEILMFYTSDEFNDTENAEHSIHICTTNENPTENTYQSVEDYNRLIANACNTIATVAKNLNDQQIKSLQKHPINKTIVNVLKEMVDAKGQESAEQAAVAGFALKIGHGPMSDFKGVLSKAKKEWPNSVLFKDPAKK